jgi:flagellar assembly factor FliW
MPTLATRYFGELTYDAEAEFGFPSGIPGFEDHTRFLFIEQPHAQPLVFMQSFDDPSLCFMSVPVFVADPNYRLELTAEDRTALGLTDDAPVEIGPDVVCLALVTATEGSDPTANLASPIVLNLRNRKAVQSIQGSSKYSLRHPLLAQEEVAGCS